MKGTPLTKTSHCRWLSDRSRRVVFLFGTMPNKKNNNKDIPCITIREKKIGIIDRTSVSYVLN